MSADTAAEPTIDLDAEVEVVGVSTFGDYVCVKQGDKFFSVEVGDPDEPANYQHITAEEAEEIRVLTAPSTMNAGKTTKLDVIRRSVAPKRDELLELWYVLNPQDRAVRDYLRAADVIISDKVAVKKLGEEEVEELKAQEDRLMSLIDGLDHNWPSDGWDGAANAAAAHARKLRPLEQELAEIHEKLGRHRPDVERYYPKGVCLCGAKLKGK